MEKLGCLKVRSSTGEIIEILTKTRADNVCMCDDADMTLDEFLAQLKGETTQLKSDLTKLDASKVSNLRVINNINILTLTEEGNFYGINMTNVPTSGTSGYITVKPLDNDYRVVCWREYYSTIEYTNVLVGGEWIGWSTQFLPLTGGTLSDTLAVERMNGSTKGKLRLFPQNRTVNGKDAVTIGYSIDDVSKAFLTFNETGIQLCNRTNYKDYNIFGEYNKPSGSYTGNGSATERIIPVKGIGNTFVKIVTSGYEVLVGFYGAIYWNHTDAEIKKLLYTDIRYVDGNIVMKSTAECINGNGKHFDWYVL